MQKLSGALLQSAHEMVQKSCYDNYTSKHAREQVNPVQYTRNPRSKCSLRKPSGPLCPLVKILTSQLMGQAVEKLI